MTKLHPEAIFIQLHTYCNSECINCPFEFTYNSVHQNGRMSKSTWNKILTDLIEMDYSGQVGFYLHHEPLIDKTLFNKIKDINEKTKAYVVLSTNGQLLTEENIEKLVKAKPRKVHLNINSGNKEEYETSMKGLNYKTTIQNCRNFIDKAKDIIDIEINCPVIEGFDVNSLKAIFPDVKVNLDYWANSRGGLLPEFYHEEKGSRFKNGNYCKQPSQNFNILFDGSTIACCMDWMHETKNDYPNIHNSSILKVYSEIKKLENSFEEGDYKKYKMCEACSKEMGFYRNNSKLKILITNHHLYGYTGSEVFTLTLAKFLQLAGHEITVYSKYVADIEKEFKELGITIVRNLEEISDKKFDVAHIHHNISLIELRSVFPELPVVFLSQGIIPFLEQPPIFELGVSIYLAISEEIKNNFISHGISEKKIEIIGNLVDTETFYEKNPINIKPQKALVISSRIDRIKEQLINDTCNDLDIDVEFIGGRFGEVNHIQVNEKINKADIVFSLGRGAIEAMIAGRCVVVFDYLGGDGIVTPNSYKEIKKHNFSGRRYKYEYSKDELKYEILKYEINKIKEVQAFAIRDYSAENTVKKLEKIYHEVIHNKIEDYPEENLFLSEFLVNIIKQTHHYAYAIGQKATNNIQQETFSELLTFTEKLIEEEKFDKAEIILDEIENENPNDIDILNDLAVVSILKNNHIKALKSLNKVLTLDPANEIAIENYNYLIEKSNEFQIDEHGKIYKDTFAENKIFNFLPKLNFEKISNFKEFGDYNNKMQPEYEKRKIFEKKLIKNYDNFTFRGVCNTCKTEVDFHVDFSNAYETTQGKIPNWRERLVCPNCNLNNRMRLALHIIDQGQQNLIDKRIFIAEQTTPTYQHIKQIAKEVIGSEYLGENFKPGEINSNGIRHEDFTNLSFSDHEFNLILSFEVFEHVPDFKKAFAESYRVLQNGGKLIFTVPFNRNSEKNIIRAKLNNDGTIDHILPAEYHGDPINTRQGCLCYYHFGWEVLDNLKDVGFVNAYTLFCYSKDYGYLGGDQVVFIAEKK